MTMDGVTAIEYRIDDADGEAICKPAVKGTGGATSQNPKRIEFPCGLSLSMQLTQQLHMGQIHHMNRVHLRHHELGHTKSPWEIDATAHYDNKEDPTELTSTHMTCSDMEV